MRMRGWTLATVALIAVTLLATEGFAACGSCGPADAAGAKSAEVGKASCAKCAAAGKECACSTKSEAKSSKSKCGGKCGAKSDKACAKCAEAGKKCECPAKGTAKCTGSKCGGTAEKSGGPCGGSRCGGKKAGGGHAMNVISTGGLKAMLDSGVKVTVLDARTGKYDDGRRIPGAGSLAANATDKQAAEAIPSKDALVVTYCNNLKCPASKMLAEQLKKLGYKNVIEYPLGIEGWADAGNDVARSQ